MRVARRTFLASTMASLAAPAVMRVAFADAPQFSLKLHHAFSAVSSAHDKFLAPWARQVEAQSGGRIRIDLFPSMQLGGAPADLFDQARDGVVDLAWSQPCHTPGRFPKIEAFELPFLPSRRALVSSKAVEDYARANLADEFREVHPICFSCSDRGVLHTNRPVRTIEEIRDLRLHVQTRFAVEAVHWLGAVAVPMARRALAISQHVVDGGIDPWNIVPTFKLNDLLKTHTEFSDSSLSTTTFVLAMNKATYDRLPRDLKTVIDNNSGQPVATIAGAMWDVQAAAVVDMVGGRGDPITTLLPEAVARWRKATEPVVEAWLKDMKEHKVDGGKLLANARALQAKYVNEPEPQPAQPAREPQPAEAKAEPSTPPKVEATTSTPQPSTPPKPAVKPTMSATTPASQPTPAPTVATPSPAPAAHPAASPVQPAPATASVTPAPSPAPAAPPAA